MPFEIYKRGKIWHYRGTVGGQRLRGSCRTTSKEIAQRYASEIENRAWKGHLDGPGAILTFANAVHSYRAAGKSGRFLEPIEDHFQDKLVKDIRASEIRQLAITLYPNASGATRNRNVIVPAQAVINFAADQELCDHIRIKRFPINTKVKTPISWEWVKSFMEHANPHLGALCAFMFLTGARVSEAIGVLWVDVDLGEAKALIRQTKVGKERIAHLPPELIEAIEKIEGERVGKVFKYSTRHTAKPQWNKTVKKAGIAPLPFHSCRHGFATTLLRNGVDAVTVAKLGGWSGPQLVFSTYGHAAEDRTIVNKLTGAWETQSLDKDAQKR